ncbi:MAG: histidine phosphatase family protein [Cyanobacteria bacterium]|nr:histidine phosphatase family protein [Cyanobacteriota bacterium]MDA1245900.1 histidine phosphatase family protein [Cyanobacteriota bacterium]
MARAEREPAERELLLWRHGIAEDHHPDLPDQERALTDEGRQRTAAVAAELCRLQLQCDCLLSSPLRRALQTAEIGVEAGLAPELVLEDLLVPGGDPRPLLQAGSWRRLCLVGHEPDLGELASSLLGVPAGTISVRKAGIVLLRIATTGASLEALIGPRLLRLRRDG